MSFEPMDLKDFVINPITAFRDGWALLTAGNEEKFNSMTISWGALGELWGKDVAFTFVRPQRYTLPFMENGEYFTIALFDGTYRKELGAVFGSLSGSSADKYALTGFTPEFYENWVFPGQAKTVLLLKKIAVDRFEPSGFIAPEIESNYAQRDYHYIYTGEIMGILKSV